MKELKPLLRRITKLRILVVGDVMLDHYIWGDATRISPEAPVPVVDIAKDTWTAGGAANVALNIASLAFQVPLSTWERWAPWIFIVAIVFDYQWLKTLAWPIYLVQIGLLVMTLAIGTGVVLAMHYAANGAVAFDSGVATGTNAGTVLKGKLAQ